MNADAWVQVGGELVTLVTVLLTYLATRGKVSQVHTLVNNASDKQVQRIDQLSQVIQGSGGKIPPTPSGPALM